MPRRSDVFTGADLTSGVWFRLRVHLLLPQRFQRLSADVEDRVAEMTRKPRTSVTDTTQIKFFALTFPTAMSARHWILFFSFKAAPLAVLDILI